MVAGRTRNRGLLSWQGGVRETFTPDMGADPTSFSVDIRGLFLG